MAKIPDSIGKYKITEEIAQGGMGAVYKGEHPTLDRSIILKKLTLRGNASIRERFRREARIMMDFKNDHIVQVYDHFRQGSYYYIVQEYIDGISLEELIQRERYLPSDIALLILLDLCSALCYAHSKDVVHRDVKPANVLLSRGGEVKLVDFGIAASREFQEDGLTRDGMTLGTPSYMAPEQFRNTKNVDKRADIYSIGVLLYEMVTGKKPFPGDLTASNIRKIQQGKFTHPRKHNPTVSRHALRIIRKAMRPRPQRRYQDLAPLVRILTKHVRRRGERELRQQLVRLTHAEPYQTVKRKKPRRMLKWAVVLVIVLVTAAATGYYYLYEKGNRYELFHGDEYGALKISVKMRKDGTDKELKPVKLLLYRETASELETLGAEYFTFTENILKETGDFYYLESGKEYLPAGPYRIKLMTANSITWTSIKLSPRTEQKRTADNRVQRFLNVDMPEPVSLPLRIDYRVWDEETGEDISAAAEVLQAGRWVPLTGFTRAVLKTGTVYSFRFSKPNYRSKRFDLMLAPGQSGLKIECGLAPF